MDCGTAVASALLGRYLAIVASLACVFVCVALCVGGAGSDKRRMCCIHAGIYTPTSIPQTAERGDTSLDPDISVNLADVVDDVLAVRGELDPHHEVG